MRSVIAVARLLRALEGDLLRGRGRRAARGAQRVARALPGAPLGRAGPEGLSRHGPLGRLVAALSVVFFLAPSARAEIRCVAVSADGKHVAACDDRKTIELWELPSGELLRSVKNENETDTLAFTPDGKTLAVGTHEAPGFLVLYSVPEGKLLRTEKIGDLPALSLAYSPDGKKLLAGGMSGLLKVYDAETLKELVEFKGSEYNYNTVAWAPDGKTIAAGCHDKAIRIYEAESGKLKATIEGCAESVDDIDFTKDGKALASADHTGTVKLWDVARGKETARVKGDEYQTVAVAFSPDGEFFAWGGKDGTVNIWDRAQVKEHIVLDGKNAPVKSLVYTPDGKFVVVGDTNGYVRVLEVETKTKTLRAPK